MMNNIGTLYTYELKKIANRTCLSIIIIEYKRRRFCFSLAR